VDKEIKNRLEKILKHWMDHNLDHASEYRKWAKKAKKAGFENVATAIEEATEGMEISNSNLSEALDLLKE